MNSLQILQQKVGIKPDGLFGPKTFKYGSAYLGLSHKEAVHFWAQCCHETAGFTVFEENLNYSTKGLLTYFGKYFKTIEAAKAYARKPELIANRVYSARMGNGDELSGDGWRYRGRGAIQLTGYENYYDFIAENYGIYLEDLSIEKIERIINKVANDDALNAAIWYFEKNKLFDMCTDFSIDTIKKITKRINGGYNGFKHRFELTLLYNEYKS